MAIHLEKLTKIAEGKTKIIYENPDDKKTVFMVFKDDITAGSNMMSLKEKHWSTGRPTGTFLSISIENKSGHTI